MTIGSRLRDWRKGNKLKTTEISEKTGISTGALSNYENDKREISCNFLLKLQEIYQADIYYILTGVKQTTPSDEEKELLDNLKLLSDKERYKFYGRIEEAAERYKNDVAESSTSKIG